MNGNIKHKLSNNLSVATHFCFVSFLWLYTSVYIILTYKPRAGRIEKFNMAKYLKDADVISCFIHSLGKTSKALSQLRYEKQVPPCRNTTTHNIRTLVTSILRFTKITTAYNVKCHLVQSRASISCELAILFVEYCK